MTKEFEAVKKFFEFVSIIIDKPAMFNVNNIEDIGLVIFGYQNGILSTNSIESNVLGTVIEGFRKFINNEFSSKEDFDWVRLIRFYSASNQHSIELFKEKFNKYYPQALRSVS